VPNNHTANPVVPMPENIAFGREGFSRYFISCRGLEGQTSGAPFVARMSSPVPFLAPADVQACGDRQLKWIVDNGLWPPGSKGVLTDQQIWSLNCHDVHGTGDYAELRKPANAICLECHAPGAPNGPRAATFESHFGNDRQIQDSESVQSVPSRQTDSVSGGAIEGLAGNVAVAG